MSINTIYNIGDTIMADLNKFFDAVAIQNKYCNQHGQIPKSSFIQHWHKLSNEEVEEIMVGCYEFMQIRKVANRRIAYQMKVVLDYINDNSQFHYNVANPNLKDEKILAKQYGKNFNKASTGKNIKTEFWILMMLFRELFNTEMGINIANADSDINNYELDWDGLDPEYETPTQFEKTFEFV